MAARLLLFASGARGHFLFLRRFDGIGLFGQLVVMEHMPGGCRVGFVGLLSLACGGFTSGSPPFLSS